MESDAQLSLDDRLLGLYEHMAYFHKGGVNEFHRYSYLLESDVKRRFNEGCRKYGLVYSVSFTVLNDPTPDACVVACKLTVRGANDPGRAWAEWQGVGSGSDKGDKAAMKACTAAFKYAVISGCSIASGDDPEGDGTTDAAELLGRINAAPNKTALNALKAEVMRAKGTPHFDGLVARLKERLTE